ncbi:MAG: GNAT family N-acetyltransferase [Cyanobacteria bacterium REEB67]|nr:GNAT family N-acetyltransferase [Cyanobacteria bacterium REEB67]
MPFQPLSSTDFLSVLNETRSIWSAGLKPDEYCHYNYMQQREPWGRKHQELWGYRSDNGEIAASLKLYRLSLMSRHQTFPCYGVGAIYSMQKYRGQGFGAKIVEAMIEKAQDDKQAAVLLFSDIGTAFYEQFGFYEMGTIEFSLPVEGAGIDAKKLSGAHYKVTPLIEADLELMERHHRRWLAQRPFGVCRSLDYFRYKVHKEDYLNRHSRLPWPKLHTIMVGDGLDLAYVIYEISSENLRVLELVTSQALVENIWRAVFAEAVKHGVKKIKSWESNVLELAPSFSLKSFFASTVYKTDFVPTIYYSQRSWGKVMILPLENEVLPWLRTFPSPILELDHL